MFTGNVDDARKLFDRMLERNTFPWNAFITSLSKLGFVEEAARHFGCIPEPDQCSWNSMVPGDQEMVTQIHASVSKSQYSLDVFMGSALVDMYGKCGNVACAQNVFDSMTDRNAVSWNSLITCYEQNGPACEVLYVFVRTMANGFVPDEVTLASVISASVKTARLMYSNMTDRNIVSWNALFSGYTQKGDNEGALGLFRLLKRESIWPTHYTFGNLLNACTSLADLKLGRQVHALVLKHGFRFQTGQELDIFVGNSLIDMYMKCGSVEDGSFMFKHMVERDWVSWNAMIVGHTRLVQEGCHYFQSMIKDHGLEPLTDHYTCMVDLLGRAGCLNEAKNLIESMPMSPDNIIWGSLLAACKVHGDIKLGEVAEKLLDIDSKNSGPCVLLSNTYAELRRWRDVMRVRKLMRQQGVVKQPGCSWIEIHSQMHVFMVKDKRHPQKKEIYLLLKTLIKQMKLAGYVPDTGDSEDDEVQDKSNFTLSEHLEVTEVAVVE
ncbi:hypothetical protein RHMOL_Rhmol10G0188500 [Rhododendron molle]|uniref:Uncharacterized protein n=1 Tax=Rhododendron molle TaxID=49168 RepID=A0ACC0M4Y6_RHOML|nr:hypothetical protein RHMOL_Rhmol10G0188500 [Rhododendron molle]